MMNVLVIKRLEKEIEDIKKGEISNVSFEPINGNIFEWKSVIFGPIGTPYEGGVFNINISIPSKYPMQPPSVIFKTKIYHPNINLAGHICLDILKNNWSPALTISKVLLSICSLLSDPNPNDPLVPEIANIYTNNRELYIKTAKEWTLNYASF